MCPLKPNPLQTFVSPATFWYILHIMEKFSCIIFDLDGTITSTNDLIFATFNHISQKYTGKVYSPNEIVKMFGPTEEVVIEQLVGKERINEAMNDFYSFYESHHSLMAGVYDGIREMLEYLKNHNVILAIFTGKGKRSSLISLNKIGIIDLFDLIISGNDVKNHKPSSEGIIKVIDKFKLEKNEVLMVGDSVADVKAANEAGIKIAAVLWDSYAKENVLQMNVDYKFYNVKEFFDWVKGVIPA